MSDGDSQTQTLLSRWKSAFANYDIAVRATIVTLVTTLEQIAQVLARDEDARVNLGASVALWADLHKLWRDLTRAQLTFWDDEEETGEVGDKEKDLRAVCGSLAKFTRNIVAGVPENQVKAFENEPDIRRLLHYHTSWTAMEADSESISVARILAQALSNIVTTNETLMSKLWDTYMNLPEDQVILIRLLASPDPHTVLTVLIFTLNCIHGSRMRTTMLTRTGAGARVCVSILDDMVKLYDAEEASVGAQAFDVGYDILVQLIEQGLVPDLYAKFNIPEEIITPHQTTLLKIVDSYLQSIQLNHPSTRSTKIIKVHRKISPMLAKCFLELSSYGCKAVQRSVRQPYHSDLLNDDPGTPESTNPVLPPAELDVMLPKVCEALVLVTQCIVTITLEADERKAHDQTSELTPEPDLKAFFNETRSDDGGIVGNLIDLLRLLDAFLPRINFGKPVLPSSSDAPIMDPPGFQYLKRDLVRLLGILCHGVRTMQDQVRDAGGIPVVMSLCVIDERNPYLREHAIFTLHCLLKDNAENQAIVDAIRLARKPSENDVRQRDQSDQY